MRVIVDAKKRVSLAGALDRLNLKPGDAVDVSVDDDRAIILLPYEPRCSVCGTQGGLLAEFGDDPVRRICTSCAHVLTTTTLTFDPKK